MSQTTFIFLLLVALVLARLRPVFSVSARAMLIRFALVVALLGITAGLAACPRTPQSPPPVYDGNPNGEEH